MTSQRKTASQDGHFISHNHNESSSRIPPMPFSPQTSDQSTITYRSVDRYTSTATSVSSYDAQDDRDYTNRKMRQLHTQERLSGPVIDQQSNPRDFSNLPKERKTRERPSKRHKPNLNILTEFSQSVAPFHMREAKLQAVQVKKPVVGTSSSDAIKSSKAEHAPGLPSGSQKPENSDAFLGGKETRKQSDGENRTAGVPQVPLLHRQQVENPARQFTSEGSIVVRFATTFDQATPLGLQHNSHKSSSPHATDGWTSAVFSATIAPWGKDPSPDSAVRCRRPASSFYSTMPYSNSHERMETNTPAVPQISPAFFNKKEAVQVTKSKLFLQVLESQYGEAGNRTAHYKDQRRDGVAKVATRRMSVPALQTQQSKPSPDLESDRRKSQGWWNLMLSPMLSRAGTIAYNRKVDGWSVPPVPNSAHLRQVDLTSGRHIVNEISPATPRRAGLHEPQSDRWSQWTDEADRSPSWASDSTLDEQAKRHEARDFTLTALPSSKGFQGSEGRAAEYFHACAIEQLTGTKYFECQNHCCDRGSPCLKSVYTVDSLGRNQAGIVAPSEVVTDISKRAAHQDLGTNLSAVSRDGSDKNVFSPTIRRADIASVIKARAVNISRSSASSHRTITDSKSSTDNDTNPQISTSRKPSTLTKISLPNNPRPTPGTTSGDNSIGDAASRAILSPGPITPATHGVIAPPNGFPLEDIRNPVPIGQAHPIIIKNFIHRDGFITGPFPERQMTERSTLKQETDMNGGAIEVRSPLESVKPKESRSLWRRMACYRRSNKAPKPEKSVKVRIWRLSIALFLFLCVLGSIVFAILFHHQQDETPTQSQWLNLTGYPPVPTGISTIARPDNIKTQTQCVQPSTLWTCSLPKERQSDIAPNSPDQPNFRFAISFQNGTVPVNMTIPLPSIGNQPSAGRKRSLVQARNPFSNTLFTPIPDPPPRADQIFLGNTTDNNLTPFEGEITPFYFSLLPSFPVTLSNATTTKRDVSSQYLQSRQDSNLSLAIPPPEVLADGSAAPAQLLPEAKYPTSQPVRLFNRGRVDEHYGFYTYYDKSIFMKSAASVSFGDSSDTLPAPDPADTNGGALRNGARARCTFSQTRFLVQIWTNSNFNARLLLPTTPIAAAANATNPSSSTNNNSATNFDRPGSFPYPVTITVDRHGGDVSKKKAYCYGVNEVQVIQEDVKGIIIEDRGAAGTIINPAQGLVSLPDSVQTNPNVGGVDGGTGGCKCVWQNWN